MSAEVQWDQGSFRDPEGSVFLFENGVYRTFSSNSLSKIENLIHSPFFQKLMTEGSVVKTSIIKNNIRDVATEYTHLLQHEKIPFISYPYEWSFYMLKDAALTTLTILKECLSNDFILKDGTAWNLTFYNAQMCFFDILSIDTYEEGQTWDGYSQFCNEFLYPLLLKSYKDIDFQMFFKGGLKGINAPIAAQFFSKKDWFKPGVFKHLILSAKLEQNKGVAKTKIREKVQLPLQSLLGIVDNLYDIISSLEPKHDSSIWQDYAENNTYQDSDATQKAEFVSNAMSMFKSPNTVIDLGCNTGTYSRIAEQSAKVVSSDIDSACIDKIFLEIKKNKLNITPIVLDLMNPSSQCGWNLKERDSIYSRLNVDAFFSLALIHHICIASNVPLERFIAFLHSLAPQGVLEWVDKEDPMVQILLKNRKDVFANYTWDNFELIVSKYFKIQNIQDINNGTRKLCLLIPLQK